MQLKQPEGATLIADVSGLKAAWIANQRQLNEVESENILKAINRYIMGRRRSAEQWFTPAFLRRIHREMLGDVWDWAGEYRRASTNIGSPPYRIASEVAQLCDDVQFWLKANTGMPLIEQAARIHHRLVAIHPFENGNGRHSRLVSDLYLRSHQHPYPLWPSDLDCNGQHRSRYIKTLKAADWGDYSPLILLMSEWAGLNQGALL